jgi:hypothetical protein
MGFRRDGGGDAPPYLCGMPTETAERITQTVCPVPYGGIRGSFVHADRRPVRLHCRMRGPSRPLSRIKRSRDGSLGRRCFLGICDRPGKSADRGLGTGREPATCRGSSVARATKSAAPSRSILDQVVVAGPPSRTCCSGSTHGKKKEPTRMARPEGERFWEFGGYGASPSEIPHISREFSSRKSRRSMRYRRQFTRQESRKAVAATPMPTTSCGDVRNRGLHECLRGSGLSLVPTHPVDA